MAQGTGGFNRRLIQLSPSADRDRFAIYAYTEQQRGAVQAANYNDYLETVMQQLAEQPATARFVPDRDNTRVFVARWKRARDGHRIFFRETANGILVLRILHTAQDWPTILNEE